MGGRAAAPRRPGPRGPTSKRGSPPRTPSLGPPPAPKRDPGVELTLDPKAGTEELAAAAAHQNFHQGLCGGAWGSSSRNEPTSTSISARSSATGT